MKWSIKKIFDNITRTIVLIAISLAILASLTLSMGLSNEKVDLIIHQKALIKEAYELGREDIQLSNIQLSGIIDNLKYDIIKMQEAFSYDLLGNYVFGYSDEYIKDLERLEMKQLLYIEALDNYYDQNIDKLEERFDEYEFAQDEYERQLSEIEERHILYEIDKFNFIQYIIYLIFIVSIISALWFSRRLSFVYKDIKTLFSVDLESKDRVYLTEESEMIVKRMSKKITVNDNPAFIDPITEINNYKGLLHGYANRKGNNGTVLAVCVFSLDSFRDIEKKYQKEMANTILKKVAFVMSLYEQHTDVLGRIDYDQFVLVINRSTKDIALNDCEQIRKNIQDTKFKGPKGERISITTSGGFVIKAPNKQLDQTIAHAKEILHVAIAQGGNKITQLKDRAEKSLK